MPAAPAGLHPRGGPRPFATPGEAAVFEALRSQLPPGWSAWHSLRVFTRDRREAEADFVVADPARGLLVLEVKDGAVEVRDGVWLQNGRVMMPPPLEQAHRAVKLVADRLREACGAVPPFGIGVVLPRTPYSQAGGPDDVRRRVIGAHELAHLDGALRALFAAAVPERPPPQARWIEALHEIWGETWRPSLRLGALAKDEEERSLRLDADQIEILRGLEGNARLVVRGGAGTGKTLLVREAARRLAADGARVLVLCFTDALATWLRREVPPSVTVETTRRFAASLLEATGAELPPLEARDARFWSAVVARTLAAAPEMLLEPPWDAVVVDESQDLDERDWELARCLSSRPGSRFWVFGDDAQGFWKDRRPPADLGGTTFVLTRTYRCHPAIQAIADRYAGREADTGELERGIEAGRVRIAAAPNREAARKKLVHEIDALRKEGFAPADIAIVTVVGQTTSGTIATATSLGRQPLHRADQPAPDGSIVADTFLRFKGLERPAVIVTDLPEPRKAEDDRAVRMHIAVSRARAALRLVGTRSAMLADPVLRERI